MRILVFQHVDVEHPGVFRDFWNDDGHEWVPIELDVGEQIPVLDGFDAMVAMGGPMDVWQVDEFPWLTDEIEAIRRWVVQRQMPYLGICLGHQLLAVALGGTVSSMDRPEVGLENIELTADGLRDPILAGAPSRIETFQWHGSEVAEVPRGAVVLASNSACTAQSIRWGRYAYGLQYHCEITETTVSEWQKIPEYQASLDKALGPELSRNLEGLVAEKLVGFRGSAKLLYDNFMKIVGEARTAKSTPSPACP